MSQPEDPVEPLPERWPFDPAERGRAMAAAGVIGGARPGAGRPRRDRYSRLIADAMEEHVDEVVDALRAGLGSDNTRTRVMAARACVDLAVRHDAVAQRDEHHAVDTFVSMSSDEVRAAAAAELVAMLAGGELGLDDLAQIAPAAVIEGSAPPSS